MRLSHTLFAACLFFPLSAFGQSAPATASSAPAGKPTVAEAQAFMDKAEADLLDLVNQSGQAQWLQETDITDDSEAVAAKTNERLALRTNELVLQARRFDG